VPESSLPVWPERNDAPRHADLHMLGGQLLGCSFAEFFGHLLRCVCPLELMRIGRVPKRFNLGEFFATLMKLVERLKFQRKFLSRSRPAV
jgi:hypothetical protein